MQNQTKAIYILAGVILLAIIVFIFKDKGSTQKPQPQSTYDDYLTTTMPDDTSAALALKMEKERKTKEITARNRKLRNNWRNYVKAELTPFNTGLLGGINNFYVKLENNYKYVLDVVKVEVNYRRYSGDLIQSRIITFTDVQPFQLYKEKGEDLSGVGSKLDVEIIEIKCRKINFWMQGLYDSEDSVTNSSPDTDINFHKFN